MTDETKELFDAPWAAYPLDDVGNASGNFVCSCETPEMAHRLARLPELHDALMEAARVYCPHASFDCRSEKECPHIQIRTGICKRCVALGWIDLLRKVRDGE